MRTLILIAATLLLSAVLLPAQRDTALLNADFVFADGVYLSLEQLRQNDPAYSWSEVEARLAANRDSYSAQVEYIRPRAMEPLPMEQVFALVLDGLPYIQVTDPALQRAAAYFAGLRIRGRLCLYAYEFKEQREVEMAAYNPLTGRPFRRGVVTKEEEVLVRRLIHLETGERGGFTRESLLQLMADDPKMQRTVEELEDSGLEERMYKCILIYDDRNPIYLPLLESDKKD